MGTLSAGSYALISAGIAAASATSNAFATQASNHRQRKFSREMYSRQREDALADRAHAENWALQTSDPAFNAERMRAAGYEYNPEGQAPAIDASAGSTNPADVLGYNDQVENFGGAITESANAALNTYTTLKSIEKQTAETRLIEQQKSECIARTNNLISQCFGMNIDNMIKARTQNMSVAAKDMEVKLMRESFDKLNQEVAAIRINNRITEEYAKSYPEYWKDVRSGIKLDNIKKRFDNKMAEIQTELENTYGSSNAAAFNEKMWQEVSRYALELKGMRFYNSDDVLTLQRKGIQATISHLQAMARGANAGAQNQELVNSAVVMGKDGKTFNAVKAMTEAQAESAIGQAQQASYYSSQFIMGLQTGCQLFNSVAGGIGSAGTFINGMKRNQLIQQQNQFQQNMDLYNAATRAAQTGTSNQNFMYY